MSPAETPTGYNLYYLYKDDAAIKWAPASEEDVSAYTEALQNGKSFITVEHEGRPLKMVVRRESSYAKPG